MPPTNPRMQAVLPELSDLAQGKAMGRPMIPEDIALPPKPVPLPIPGGGTDDESADLPSRPTGPVPQGEVDWEEMLDKKPPLQNMQPVDPSYGDLFKKLRPYQ